MPSQTGQLEDHTATNNANSAPVSGGSATTHFSGRGVALGGEISDNQLHRNYDHLDNQKVTDDYVGHNTKDEET